MHVSTRMLRTLTREVRHQYQGNWHAGTVWRARGDGHLAESFDRVTFDWGLFANGEARW